MLKLQLKSGKILEMNLASVEKALALYRAVIHECKKAKLDLTVADEDSIASMLMKNSEALLNIIGSELVMDCIKDCCDKVIYDKQRFTMDIFEDPKARADFFGVMLVVAMENLRPFFTENSSVFDAITSLALRA